MDCLRIKPLFSNSDLLTLLTIFRMLCDVKCARNLFNCFIVKHLASIFVKIVLVIIFSMNPYHIGWFHSRIKIITTQNVQSIPIIKVRVTVNNVIDLPVCKICALKCRKRRHKTSDILAIIKTKREIIR